MVRAGAVDKPATSRLSKHACGLPLLYQRDASPHFLHLLPKNKQERLGVARSGVPFQESAMMQSLVQEKRRESEPACEQMRRTMIHS